jgi:DNA-binding NarL/FixJ family response regulator
VSCIEDEPVVGQSVVAAVAAQLGIAAGPCVRTVDEVLATGIPDGMRSVVILDLLLRDGTDPEANVRALTAAGHRVVVLTNEARPVPLARAWDAGAHALVSKADSLDELAEAVQAQVVDDAQFMSPLMSQVVAGSVAAPQLTDREQDVMRWHGVGMSDRQVARELGMSHHTVRRHLGNIKAKYLAADRHVSTRTDVMREGLRDGVIDIDWWRDRT